jgi:hypothetical protein
MKALNFYSLLLILYDGGTKLDFFLIKNAGKSIICMDEKVNNSKNMMFDFLAIRRGIPTRKDGHNSPDIRIAGPACGNTYRIQCDHIPVPASGTQCI